MTSTGLYRWSGLALLLGAILGIIGNVLSTALFPTNSPPGAGQMGLWTILGLVSLVANMLLLIGLPGIGVRQAEQGTRLGFIGFVLTFFGGLLFMAFSVFLLVVFPYLAQAAPNALNAGPPPAMFAMLAIAAALFGVGGLLLGIDIMRTGTLPRLAGLLLLIGAVLNAVAFPLNGVASAIVSTASFVLFGVGIGWIGYVFLQARRREVAGAAIT